MICPARALAHEEQCLERIALSGSIHIGFIHTCGSRAVLEPVLYVSCICRRRLLDAQLIGTLSICEAFLTNS